MPIEEVLRPVTRGDLDLRNDRSLARAARVFGVSPQALTIRLTISASVWSLIARFDAKVPLG